MNFQEYLLQNEGDAVRGFLRSIGYQIHTPQQASVCLADFLKKNGEAGMRELLPLHPDYHLIADLVAEANRQAGCRPDKPPIVSSTQCAPSPAPQELTLANLSALQSSLVGIRGDLVNLALVLLCVYLLAKIIK